MKPNIPMGGMAPTQGQGQGQIDLWPDVVACNGERPRPIWRPVHQPAFNLHGIGFLLGTRKYGQPHLERIASWSEYAVDHGKPLSLADGEAVVAAYLRSKTRIADHAAWLKEALEATHILPRSEDGPIDPTEARRIAPMLVETHEGWLKTAPRFVAELLAEAEAARAS